jgi:hypothetical protein
VCRLEAVDNNHVCLMHSTPARLLKGRRTEILSVQKREVEIDGGQGEINAVGRRGKSQWEHGAVNAGH